MPGAAPSPSAPPRRFLVQCQQLTMEYSAHGGLKISLTKIPQHRAVATPRSDGTSNVLAVLAASGPFFIEADTEEPRQNKRVDRRFSVVGLDHHKKMDHA